MNVWENSNILKLFFSSSLISRNNNKKDQNKPGFPTITHSSMSSQGISQKHEYRKINGKIKLFARINSIPCRYNWKCFQNSVIIFFSIKISLKYDEVWFFNGYTMLENIKNLGPLFPIYMTSKIIISNRNWRTSCKSNSCKNRTFLPTKFISKKTEKTKNMFLWKNCCGAECNLYQKHCNNPDDSFNYVNHSHFVCIQNDFVIFWSFFR